MRILIAEDAPKLLKSLVHIFELNHYVADDVLVSISLDGEVTRITRQYHIVDMMLDVRIGGVVTLCILRAEEEMTVSITITEGCIVSY